ncbi:hypothetical protein [Mycolicibacterium aubagnense]|uniref:PE-PGRS family protein n=1 Tax=Mycolicibacterium aubagnense TaxID=319707 RepID=A0ABM7IHQ9_9MYCO|nr:hypothetical protein [Mycolicibacterium aubagnense]TLH68504.1 hypothetical protein C1S80_03590 [Mycolicibacterium aubagnense]WGI32213.1 hypothetical protein QDT91_23960 [Mycolicibacterium aubagnense]BBX86242.1 hypothetical protein MAUB_41150 [Mycolicibacterium aubagnense]
MHTAARPFASVGVSLAGAAAIAVAPVMAPTVSTQIHHMEAQIERAAVRLTAAVNPFEAYAQAFNNTVASLQTIVSTAQTQGPTPILTAALNNQLAALQDLLKLVSSPGSVKVDPSPQPAVPFAAAPPLLNALGATLGQIGSNLTTAVPPLLAAAVNDLAKGNVEDATNQLLLVGLNALIPLTNLLAPALNSVAYPLQGLVTAIDKLGPLGVIAANPLQNAVNVLNTLNQGFGGLQPSNALVIVGGLLGPLIQAPAAMGAAVQDVIDATRTGDLGKVATALISIPATVLNGVLNGGYGPDLSTVIDTGLPGVPLYAGGLLTSFGINLNGGPLGFTVNLPGPVAALQLLQKLVADALKPPPVTTAKTAVAATAPVAANAVPATDATTVAVPAAAVVKALPAKAATDPAKPVDQTATKTDTTKADATSTAETPTKTVATKPDSPAATGTDAATGTTGTTKPADPGSTDTAHTGSGQTGTNGDGTAADHTKGGDAKGGIKDGGAKSDAKPAKPDTKSDAKPAKPAKPDTKSDSKSESKPESKPAKPAKASSGAGQAKDGTSSHAK